MTTPEALARQNIDRQLAACGWSVQDRSEMNLYAGRGVAVREFPLKTGFADYLLFVDRKAVGVIEAKKEGVTLSAVADQAARYSKGLLPNIPHVTLPLPFLYESTGQETYFRDERDPNPRSRRVFTFHRPETLAEWVRATGVGAGLKPAPTLRARLATLPTTHPLNENGLWPPQIAAIRNLEASLAQDKPRALIQMATGAGKTFTAVNFTYRLIKFAKAHRVLFLVDRNNLGRQAFREFDQFVTPDDGRKFTELYNVQHLQSNALDHVSKVHITTIQRLFSMLSGEAEFDPANEERSLFELDSVLDQQPPKEVQYNPYLPIEYYDFIIIDECHRSIYNLWRQVLDYFDAYLIGLTATPSKHTFAFFNQNLVMEYGRPQAVADGVNVDGEVYRIRTEITEKGSTIQAGFVVPVRDRLTRAQRWQQLDDDLPYTAGELDRKVVAKDQIRTVIRTFRDKLFTDIFPGRTEVPKALVFAKDDHHAEEIVHIVRKEFGKGDAFCQKITYRSDGAPESLISAFRNSYHPRIAVTVDMIATGTDIKPLEILLFMRPVKSRLLFEQMLGRGTRVVSETEMQNVTPDNRVKDHFVIVDAVGVTEQELIDPQPLERKRSVPFNKLLEAVTLGITDPDTLSSLAARFARLARQLTAAEQDDVARLSGGLSLNDLSRALLDAADPDKPLDVARERHGDNPTPEQIELAEADLLEAAIRPLAANPDLRHRLIDLQTRHEIVIDDVNADTVIAAGFDPQASERARATVESFRQFLEEHKDEITALQILYNQPHADRRLNFEQIKELAGQLQLPPHSWTTESLWRAYAQLEKDRVRGVGAPRVLADIVSLVRHALGLDEELVPFPERVQQRYADWLHVQQAQGRAFTPEQRWWLDRIAEHIGINVDIRPEDLETGEFWQKGGPLAAKRALGGDYLALLAELNAALVG